MYQLQSGQVQGQGTNLGCAFNCMLSGLIYVNCVYWCTTYNELG